jgi:hypothetical protein
VIRFRFRSVLDFTFDVENLRIARERLGIGVEGGQAGGREQGRERGRDGEREGVGGDTRKEEGVRGGEIGGPRAEGKMLTASERSPSSNARSLKNIMRMMSTVHRFILCVKEDLRSAQKSQKGVFVP